MPALQTPRLNLRPAGQLDLEVLHTLWTNAEVRRYLWDDEVIPLEQVAAVLDENERMFREEGVGIWLIDARESNEVVGFTGYWYFFDPPQLQLLYGLDPAHWGKGYAAEASQEMLRYGFEEAGMTQIIACTDPPNHASVKVMERIGMQFQKRVTEQGQDSVFYELSRDQWAG